MKITDKLTIVERTIWIGLFSFALLHIVLEVTLIGDPSFFAREYSMAISSIAKEFSFIKVTVWENESSEAIALIVVPLSFIGFPSFSH